MRQKGFDLRDDIILHLEFSSSLMLPDDSPQGLRSLFNKYCIMDDKVAGYLHV